MLHHGVIDTDEACTKSINDTGKAGIIFGFLLIGKYKKHH
jgi:hypothetical protein